LLCTPTTAMVMAALSHLRSAVEPLSGASTMWCARILIRPAITGFSCCSRTGRVGCRASHRCAFLQFLPASVTLAIHQGDAKCSAATPDGTLHMERGHCGAAGGRSSSLLQAHPLEVQSRSACFCGRPEHGGADSAACSAARPEHMGWHRAGHSHHRCGMDMVPQVSPAQLQPYA
jgi:hypothetical protein